MGCRHGLGARRRPAGVGRQARSIDDAILWHRGEAAAAAEACRTAPADVRHAINELLESL